MAKELPYFQFEPAEYLTKDISFCSLSAQGLFANICSYYWQRGCKLTKEQLLKRLNHPEEFQELVDEGVIDLNGSDISIKFLDIQYHSIKENQSDSSSKGKIGNLKRWHPEIYERFVAKELTLEESLNIAKSSGGDESAIAKTSHIREEEIREDNIITTTEAIKEIEVVYEQFTKEIRAGHHTQWAEQTYMQLKLKKGTLTNLIREFKSHLIRISKSHPNVQKFKEHLNNWLNNQDSLGKLNQYKRKALGAL